MNAPPVVSIVVPTRNRGHVLRRALDGIAAQTFADFECLIVDDGSSAEVRAICAELLAGFDARFRLLVSTPAGGPGTGPAAARNRGIRECRGEFITFCDDDDQWSAADLLDAAMRVMRQGPDRSFFFGDQQGQRDGKVMIESWYPGQTYLRPDAPRALDQPVVYEVPKETMSRFLGHFCPHLNTVLVRREVMERTGLFWEKAAFGEDWDMVMRLADVSQRFFYRPDPTVTFTSSVADSWFNDTPVLERSLLMMATAHHVRYRCRDGVLRAGARKAENWHLRELARLKAAEGEHRQALSYALQALCTRPTPNTALGVLRHGWQALTGRS
jgi:glycosyltransferase involved in cell wall biosynthesis